MPMIKTYNNSYDFKVVEEETRDKYGCITYFFLKEKMMVEETYSDDSGKRVNESSGVSPIAEFDDKGLCEWDGSEHCWIPMDEKFAKAYNDHIAEKALLDK